MSKSTDLSNIATIAQKKAANPFVSAWVSASAGSGKTKVLTDRVLRLLLAGNAPETILCLTYTKAAAAEMSIRLSKNLREWIGLDDNALRARLIQLTDEEDEDVLNAQLKLARTLFARLLDVKGGMKIMTIHGFCQSLLKRFPLEADVSPSFEVVEELISKNLLGNCIKKTIQNPLFNKELYELSQFLDEATLTEFLLHIRSYQASFENLTSHFSGLALDEQIYRNLGLELSTSADSIKRAFTEPENFDAFVDQYLTKTDHKIRDKIIKKGTDEDRQTAKALIEALDKLKSLTVAKATCALIHIVLEVLSQYTMLKNQKGLLDYTDLILKTSALLCEKDMTAWVLYKLDGGIDHILLDEAQDSGPEQWSIIRALSEEFFAGAGRKDDKIRTLFAVGDKKQSIYRFQGADANEFEKMRQFFKLRITASENIFEDVQMNVSFRSAQPVLDMVNLLLENKQARSGVLMADEKATHFAHRQGEAGRVEIWPLEEAPEKLEEPDPWNMADNLQAQLPAVVKISTKIAERISNMLKNKEILESQNRPIQAGDIMILVRSRDRQSLVSELVKALKKHDIPVAGVDRLVLNAHIAVQDLTSLAEFLLLPDNDLNLAEILKSPLFELSEEELFDLCYERKGSLWASVAAKRPDIYALLKDLLDKTDTMPPFELFSYVLDTLGYRDKFLRRLGQETNEMLDELLNLALNFEKQNMPSLQSFVQFLKTDNIEIKRDLDNNQINAVRIMTIHGSKGLQSRIVFMPDTFSKVKHAESFLWKNGLPIWVPKAAFRSELCLKAQNEIIAEDDQEYNRLLYVALTRAQDRLYIAGFKTGRNPPEENWYNLIAASAPAYRADTGAVIDAPQTVATAPKQALQEMPQAPFKLPAWYFTPAPQEPMPSKPLSPSKLTEEPAAPSPLSPEQEKAMRRGSFIHKLLQYLPNVPTSARAEFIAQNTPPDIVVPASLIDILQKPEMQILFGENSRSEVPIVGVTSDGKVISGQIDRLVVSDDEVLIIDYKTNRYPPQRIEDVPESYLEQIKAYKDLLKNIFSCKKIRCFLLWTTDATLMEIK